MPGSYFLDCSVLLSLYSLPGGSVTVLLPAAADCRGRTPVSLFMAARGERTVIYCASSSAAVNLQHGDGAIRWNPNFLSDTELEKGELAGLK